MTRKRMPAGKNAIEEPQVPYEVITLDDEDDDEITIVHPTIQPKKKRNKKNNIEEMVDKKPSSAENLEENYQKPAQLEDGELQPTDPPQSTLTQSTNLVSALTPQLDVTPAVPLHSKNTKKRGASGPVLPDPENKKVAQVHPEIAAPQLRMKNNRIEKKTGTMKEGEKEKTQQEKKSIKSSLQIRAANNFKRMISATITPDITAEEAKSLRDTIENGEKLLNDTQTIESYRPPISPVYRKDETSASSNIMLQKAVDIEEGLSQMVTIQSKENGVNQVSRDNCVSRNEEELMERREINSSNTANNSPSLKYTDILGNKIIVDGSVVPPSGSTVVTPSDIPCPSTPLVLNDNGTGMEVALPMPPSIPTRSPGRKKSKVVILEKITHSHVSTPSTPALQSNVQIVRKAVESNLSSAGLFVHHIHKKSHDLATLEAYMGKFAGWTSISLTSNPLSAFANGVIKFRSSEDLREPLETGKEVTEMGSWHTINGHDVLLTPLIGPNKAKVTLMIKDKENEEEQIRERETKKNEEEEEERRSRKKDEERRKRDKEERYRDRSPNKRKWRSRSRDKYRERKRSNERRRSRSRERRRRDHSRNDARKRRDRSNEIINEIMEKKYANSKQNEDRLNKPVHMTKEPLVSHQNMQMLMNRLKTMPDTTGHTEEGQLNYSTPEMAVPPPNLLNHMQHYPFPFPGQMGVPPPLPSYFAPSDLTENGWSSHQTGTNFFPHNYDQYYNYYHPGQQ